MANQWGDVAASLKGLFDPGDWLGMKPQLDPSASLLALDHKPNEGEVTLRMAVGGFVLAVTAIIIYFVEDGFVIFVVGGFGFFGLLNLVYGFIQSRFEKSMLFTGHEVQVRTRGLLGRREWREPIAGYRGVRLREHHMRKEGVGNIASTKTYHVIELVHDDPRRVLPLHVSEGGEAPRDVQEAFSRRFKLPALAPDSGGEAARAHDALDAPLAAQPAADPGPPPSGVTVRRKGAATVIRIGQGRTGKVVVVVSWLAIPILFGGIGFMIDPEAGLMAGGMAVLFVALMLGLGKLVGGKSARQDPALVVEPDRVWIDRPKHDDRLAKFGRGIVSAISGMEIDPSKRPPETIARRAIEQIRIDTYTSHYSGTSSVSGHGGASVRDRLVIEGDGGRITFVGSQFDKKKLEWVRDYLRFALAGG